METVLTKKTSSELLDHLAYNCSHSICSPLKTIKGLVNLLESIKDNDGCAIYIEMMWQCIDKLELLTRNFDQLLENMETDLRAEEIDFQGVLEAVTDTYQDTMRQKNLELALNIEDCGSFYSDKNRVQNILSHLLSNAVAFFDENKINRAISIQIVTNNQACRINVSDNGCGIAAEIQDKIYQLFYRGSQRSGGAGMGLFVVSEILKKMHGTISVKSCVGKSTEFSIVIPNLVSAGA